MFILRLLLWQGVSPQKIYHVTVMPCYDKKLEASRPDFYLSEYETREVDCVITSGEGIYRGKITNWSKTGMIIAIRPHCLCFWFIGEVLKMLEEENVSLRDVEEVAPLDTM